MATDQMLEHCRRIMIARTPQDARKELRAIQALLGLLPDLKKSREKWKRESDRVTKAQDKMEVMATLMKLLMSHDFDKLISVAEADGIFYEVIEVVMAAAEVGTTPTIVTFRLAMAVMAFLGEDRRVAENEGVSVMSRWSVPIMDKVKTTNDEDLKMALALIGNALICLQYGLEAKGKGSTSIPDGVVERAKTVDLAFNDCGLTIWLNRAQGKSL